MQHWLATLVLVVTGVMLFWSTVSRRLGGVAGISPQDAVQLMNRQNAVVLDVRDADERDAGFIAQSRHIPLKELEARVGELAKAKDKPVVVVCASGARSATAAAVLKGKHGFSAVASLNGGLEAWKKAGLPLKKGA